MPTPHADRLLTKIKRHDAIVGIIGMGYVGLPLALAFVEKGFPVLGFDVDPDKVAKLNRGEGYIKHLDGGRIAAAVATGRFTATADFARLGEADAVLICVPTPLTPQREPDMTYVDAAAHQVRATLRPGQLIILESTTYPGTTDERLRSILEGPDRLCGARAPRVLEAGPAGSGTGDSSPRGRVSPEPILPTTPSLRATPSEARGSEAISQANPSLRGRGAAEAIPTLSPALRCGTDFFLAFSPEREDPGNPNYGTTNTPKVVGGVDVLSGDLAEALYAEVISKTVRVSSARAAEATKLMENIFRAVNIALVNELKVVYDKMGIDIWEVLDAAATKPFGFMRFNPGPGWGGHCLAPGDSGLVPRSARL